MKSLNVYMIKFCRR